MRFATADLCDDYIDELFVCDLALRSYGNKVRFAGKIETVRVFEDNILVKEALETVPEGSVLVVDGGGSKRCALLGGNLATIAQDRKLAGIIINGFIRDTAELNSINVGILALGSCPVKSKKAGIGKRDVPLVFGGVNWKKGDYVYSDEDGVIISPRNFFE